jgi:cytochrome c oxidase subunit 3
VTARPLEPYRPPNLVIGVTLLVVAEMMFFAGLISAYLVARAHADGWPPIGQPRLPIQNTAFNTLILLLSAYTIKLCLREQSRFRLLETCVLGLTFVLLQGREWLALLGHGLTLRSGPYGAYFYTLVGAHAIHVLAGLLALGWIYAHYKPLYARAGSIYWAFVVALWPILYILVYLL